MTRRKEVHHTNRRQLRGMEFCDQYCYFSSVCESQKMTMASWLITPVELLGDEAVSRDAVLSQQFIDEDQLELWRYSVELWLDVWSLTKIVFFVVSL